MFLSPSPSDAAPNSILFESTASTREWAQQRWGAGGPPLKSGDGSQFCVLEDGRPSSFSKIALPYGPVTPDKASKRTLKSGCDLKNERMRSKSKMSFSIST